MNSPITDEALILILNTLIRLCRCNKNSLFNQKTSNNITLNVLNTCSNLAQTNRNPIVIGELIEKTINCYVDLRSELLVNGEEIKIENEISSTSLSKFDTKINSSSNLFTKQLQKNESYEVKQISYYNKAMLPIPKYVKANFSNEGYFLNIQSIKSRGKRTVNKLNVENVQTELYLSIPKVTPTNRFRTNIISQASCNVKSNDNDVNSSACTTWNNFENFEVMCSCNKVGAIFDMLSEKITSNNKYFQFQKINKNIININNGLFFGFL